ncbi:MAG: 2-amino-4-hydroxy-6-hydroxymethyldihydropteridine diphosphokinase [Janthinobacterium lividum]
MRSTVGVVSMIAAIALGSNLVSTWGEPAANLREALHRLNALGEVTAVSSFRETEPVGFVDQPHFINAAAMLETSLGPLPLMHALLSIEQVMGRMRSADQPPKGPRVIDLDLLLYTDRQGRSLTLDDPDLILPHPAMHQRLFVLEPLAEIAKEMLHPVRKQTIGELLKLLE